MLIQPSNKIFLFIIVMDLFDLFDSISLCPYYNLHNHFASAKHQNAKRLIALACTKPKNKQRHLNSNTRSKTFNSFRVDCCPCDVFSCAIAGKGTLPLFLKKFCMHCRKQNFLLLYVFITHF